MSLVSSLIWRTRSARRKRIKRAIAKPKSSGGERTNASSLNRKFSKPPTMRSASYLPNSKPRSARKQSASFCANSRTRTWRIPASSSKPSAGNCGGSTGKKGNSKTTVETVEPNLEDKPMPRQKESNWWCIGILAVVSYRRCNGVRCFTLSAGRSAHSSGRGRLIDWSVPRTSECR